MLWIRIADCNSEVGGAKALNRGYTSGVVGTGGRAMGVVVGGVVFRSGRRREKKVEKKMRVCLTVFGERTIFVYVRQLDG